MSLTKPKMGSRVIENPALHVVLHQPEIPANTGNVARLCGAAELPLHLIHPLGFHVDDKHVKRAGLDYWQEVDTRHHMDFESFLRYRAENGRGAVIGFSAHAREDYTRAEVHRGDWLLFGRETFGLPPEIREAYSCFKVPIWGQVRSLNLATTVGIVVYHFLHELGRF